MARAQQLLQQIGRARGLRLVGTAVDDPSPEMFCEPRHGSRDRRVRRREGLVVAHRLSFPSLPCLTASVQVDAGGRTPVQARAQCQMLPSWVTKSPTK